jgi:CheY-like chemotaxis protein
MQQIKRKHGIVGIAMSGYGMDEDIRKSQEAGFSEHLVKPISFAQLDQAIQRLARG